MEEKLRNDILYILNYFHDGLSDVQSGSGEQQPMLNEIKSVLKRLNGKQASPPSMPELTVRKFMLKKFPPNKYIDCPVGKHHWEVIQEYADEYCKLMRSQCEGLIKQKAMEFAEWIENNDYWQHEDGLWRKGDNRITTEKLYEIFNQQVI